MSDFIKIDQNLHFKDMRGYDLQDLLVEIFNYYLLYRNSLGLPKKITFGTEIEYEGIFQEFVEFALKSKLDGWNFKSDGSLNFGGEITSPIMIDDEVYWTDLQMVCQDLKKMGANTLYNTGGHVHVGAHILGDDIDSWRLFLKIYAVYEHILFRFIYGDKLSARKKLIKYAEPTAPIIYDKIEAINSAQDLMALAEILKFKLKRPALNFSNVKIYYASKKSCWNTIEFRGANGTVNEVIWQNNINAYAKMLIKAHKKKIDEDYLDYKLKHEYYGFDTHSYCYNNIVLKDALEFVDLIFNNNLDKVYFLRQYLKNLELNLGKEMAVRTRKFWK